MPSIYGIDPGPEKSAYVLFDTGLQQTIGRPILMHGHEKNQVLLQAIHEKTCPSIISVLAVEKMESHKNKFVGQSVFETLIWIGRFVEAFVAESDDFIIDDIPAWEYFLVTRSKINLGFTGISNSPKPQVRAAIINRYGGSMQAAKGVKKNPGPLYGISGHEWDALAVALHIFDKLPSGGSK